MPQFSVPINTNDQSIDRVLANPLPVMLMLESGTTGLRPALDAAARDYAGRLLVARIDTAENPAAAERFGSSRLVLWKAGRVELQITSPTADQIRDAAKFALGMGPAPKIESAAPAIDHPIPVNEANFEQTVLRSSQPVLVDFWASWCGPCRIVAPTLEKLAREYAGKVRIAKLNVDENPRLAAKYGAHSIPQLTVFKGGKPVDQLIGAHPEPNIRNVIERVLR